MNLLSPARGCSPCLPRQSTLLRGRREDVEDRGESGSLARARRLAPVLVLVVVALFLAGCLNLKPAPDETRHFLLTADVGEEAAADAARLSVGLAPVRLPAHTASSWIAIRTGSNELRYAETARWAEPLDRNVQRVLGANLRNHSGIGSVFLGTWPANAVQCEVSVQIDLMDLDASGAIVLGAQWTVRQLRGSAVTATHSAHLTRQGPRAAEDMPGAVAALSEALAELSNQIARSLLAPPASP